MLLVLLFLPCPCLHDIAERVPVMALKHTFSNSAIHNAAVLNFTNLKEFPLFAIENVRKSCVFLALQHNHSLNARVGVQRATSCPET